MSTEICPYCQDFTLQSILTHIQGQHSSTSGVESQMNISMCHSCGNSVEHEQIIMHSFDENTLLKNKQNAVSITSWKVRNNYFNPKKITIYIKEYDWQVDVSYHWLNSKN